MLRPCYLYTPVSIFFTTPCTTRIKHTSSTQTSTSSVASQQRPQALETPHASQRVESRSGLRDEIKPSSPVPDRLPNTLDQLRRVFVRKIELEDKRRHDDRRRCGEQRRARKSEEEICIRGYDQAPQHPVVRREEIAGYVRRPGPFLACLVPAGHQAVEKKEGDRGDECGCKLPCSSEPGQGQCGI